MSATPGYAFTDHVSDRYVATNDRDRRGNGMPGLAVCTEQCDDADRANRMQS